MDANTPYLGLPAAADAAGLDLRYLRNVLAECRLVLLGQTDRRPGQKYRASLIDVLRLRVLLHLRDAGLSEYQAIYAIDLAVDPLIGGLCGVGIPVPVCVLRGRVCGAAFHVIPDEGDDLPDVYSTASHMPVPDDTAPIAITINLESVLADVLARLNPTKESA